MHSEQKVCEQEVSIGVVKKSLQTWQRRRDSSVASGARGVESQSVESVTAAAEVEDETAGGPIASRLFRCPVFACNRFLSRWRVEVLLDLGRRN